MLRYLLSRVVMTIPVLLGVLLLTFSMLHLVPGDPVRAMFIDSGGASEEQIAQVRSLLGLDKPLPVQFWNYLVGVLQGDLGRSIITNQEVSVQIARTFPSTLVLTVAAMTLAIIMGFTFGIISAVKRGTWIDSAMMVFSLSGVSIPSFWLGLLMIYFFSVNLRLIPIVGGPAWKQLIMPAVALGLPASAIIARLVRTSMLEVLSEPYVTTARAKGLGERIVLFGHALRNALLPVISVVGFQVAFILSGTIVIETIFALPGVGRLFTDSVFRLDYQVVQSLVVLLAVLVVVVNLLTDLVYALVDPRIRIG